MKRWRWMGSTTGAIVALLAGIGTPPAAVAQEEAAPLAAPQDPALYRYLDDADALLDAMGTSPPDYGFRFEGVDCWAWSMSDGYLVLAEPLGDDYRFYVFGPGDDRPFFVGDDYYAYGFEGRGLAAVYGADGALVAWRPSDDIAAGAKWLSDRGARMRSALANREPVIAPDWADGVGWFGGLVIRFDTWRHQSGWIRYRHRPHGQHHRDWHKKLDDEGVRRHRRAEWFDRWRRDGYRGSAPRNDGGWKTRPDGRPGDSRDRDGKPGGIVRPRPVAPPTPGLIPPGLRPGDARPGPGRGPRPPLTGQPGQPMPRDTRPPRVTREPAPPTTPAPVPGPVALPPAPPPLAVAPPPGRGDGRPDRPFRVRPRDPAAGTPPVVKNDVGRDTPPLASEAPASSPRAPSAPLPPPVVVAPRREPAFMPPRVRTPAPPPPPVRISPPPPPAIRAAVPTPVSRPAPAPVAPRVPSTPRVRSDAPPRPVGKGKDR
ncbi:MAG: hypothetical protein ACTHJR_19850 [Sphingomonas sp.]|uniref:hypothetical protein n=1 Tax=Sphingomonas sp. TaxID=28214 RepID=UPI003F807404